MSWFGALTLGGWLTVVTAALVGRSRTFAMFVGVIVGIYSLVASALAPSMHSILPVYAAFHVTVYVNFLALSRPRMRPLVYRILVSWPAAFFSAGTLLAMPWAVIASLGFHPWGVWVPYVLAAIGMLQSLTTKRGEIDLVIRGPASTYVANLTPHATHPPSAAPGPDERPLRIVQISDPHLGPFMSVARLRAIAERAVLAQPDLVFLTGDFLTMESQSDPDLLLSALAPLRKLPGKVFACHGNHDHEAPAVVARAMRENGIALLVDQGIEVETPAGHVQIIGMDFVFRDRKAHLERVCAAHERKPGMMRIVLLHDPGAFRHLPTGHGDLVLAGHTHGGQVGLLSLGLSWTFLRLFGDKMPDHGLWARGTDRMYVHRGTGHYGFPLRLGVPAEETVLRVHRAA
jgi:uncharacterized protein